MVSRPVQFASLLLFPIICSVALPSSARAQRQPLCRTGCVTYHVSVTPDGGTDAHPANSGPWTEDFDVITTGTGTDLYSFSCSGTKIECVSVDPASANMGPGAEITVTVTYNLGAASGVVTLTASGEVGGASDNGYYNITALPPPGPATVALRNHNGDNRDQSLCLTSGAGEGAAWECGDLVVTHGLPSYATKGRERSMTLLYNSAQAVPRPIVAATVNESNVAAPTSVFVRLSINGVARDSATYTGWGNGGSAPYIRQIVIAHDATTDSSGIYPFSLLIRNQYAGASYDVTLNDTLLVVNRSLGRFSLYGAGWSLVGVEELRITGQLAGRILWIDGDGSAKVYRNIATNTWLLAAGGLRDTLTYNTTTASYTRSLRHGVKVQFDAGGHHIRTINRVGDTTFFNWVADSLKTIKVPPGTTGTTYTLTYTSGAGGKLDKITDPAGRILDVNVASNRLTQIIDPDTTAVHTDFTYDGSGRMTGRTNRRGFTNSFIYANGLRVDTVKVRLDTASATYGVTAFRPWDEQGLAVGLSGQSAVDTAQGYTKIDGPRTNVADTAEFWIDRWGAPTQIRSPLGYVTKLLRGDASNPALVTRVQDAAGAVGKATYNGRGNVLTVTDSTHQGSGASQAPAVTTYQYNDAGDPDGPSKIQAPVDTTTITYDPSVHLPSQVTAQGGHITAFSYTTTGALRGVLNSVTEQNVRVVDTVAWTKTAPGSSPSLTTTFAYDALGNDTLVTTPGGMKTRYRRDAMERVDTVYDPLLHWVAYTLNPVNRITQVRQNENGTILVTAYNYSPSGALKSVVDPRSATRSYRYDAADRPLQMTDDVANAETRYFGPGGLLDSTRTRMGHVIKNTFDAAGQLTKTIYPANTFITGATVPGDTINRTYDAVGRLSTAQNHNGTVTYTYNLEGTTKTERQLVTGAVDITMRYWYDAGNRRTKFFNGTDTLFYTFGTDAQLSKLKVQWMAGGLAADSFNFFWDGLGRRDSIKYTNGTSVSYGYDRDGHFRMLCSKHPGGDAGVLDFLEQRVRVEGENMDGLPVTRYHYVGPGESSNCAAGSSQIQESIITATYDFRHQLLTSSGTPSAQTVRYDNSGNIMFKQLGASADSFTHVAVSNRLAGLVHGATTDVTYGYDPNQPCAGPPADPPRSWTQDLLLQRHQSARRRLRDRHRSNRPHAVDWGDRQLPV